jgi:hypothetical protein
MNRVIASLLAVVACSVGAVSAADMQEPTEVGNTTMPPGEYDMVHKGSHKTYTLMVTSKGMMIMAPDKDGVNAAAPAPVATTPAAVTPAVTTTVAPALTAPVVPAAPTAATQTAAGVKPGNEFMKGLVQQGMKQGMNQIGKFGAKGQIDKFLK